LVRLKKILWNNIYNFQIDWLVDRRHCSKDWNERSVAIRAKIQQAILDMPEHEEIKRLLGSSCKQFPLDFFSL
jgi:hypothetical protein